MMDLAERGCPALGSSSVRRRAVAPSAVTSSAVPQTISHAPLAAFTSVPGPHVSGGGGDVGGDGGDVGGGGEGGGGEGEGGCGDGERSGGGGEGGGGDGGGKVAGQFPGTQFEP